MRISFLLGACFLGVASTGAGAQNLCSDIVADTLAELRAGAGDGWSNADEALARNAAGAACVKAQSGRYGPTVPPASPAVREEVVGGGAAASGSEAARQSAGATEPAKAPSEDAEDGFTIGGLKVRGASGSPSKKPYERARDGG